MMLKASLPSPPRFLKEWETTIGGQFCLPHRAPPFYIWLSADSSQRNSNGHPSALLCARLCRPRRCAHATPARASGKKAGRTRATWTGRQPATGDEGKTEGGRPSAIATRSGVETGQAPPPLPKFDGAEGREKAESPWRHPPHSVGGKRPDRLRAPRLKSGEIKGPRGESEGASADLEAKGDPSGWRRPRKGSLRRLPRLSTRPCTRQQQQRTLPSFASGQAPTYNGIVSPAGMKRRRRRRHPGTVTLPAPDQRAPRAWYGPGSGPLREAKGRSLGLVATASAASSSSSPPAS